jgi:hypothetical protein
MSALSKSNVSLLPPGGELTAQARRAKGSASAVDAWMRRTVWDALRARVAAP